LTDLLETPALADEDFCPSWCVGGCDDDALHTNEFEGPSLPVADDEAIVRLVQERNAVPVIELGVNDADGGSALVRLSLDQAEILVDLLNDLIVSARQG
jgi:hypothetical protein